ncbi:MAG: hypothetical protein IJX99_08700 [Clostridia bacterium]|nr:hypothetical protein [Clostridia bacterium]
MYLGDDFMDIFEKICLEMIEKVREYIDDGKYIKTLEYIDKKEKQIKKICKNRNDGKYVDELVKSLK